MNTSLNCVNIISSLNMWITPKGAITAKDALCNNTTIKSIGVSCKFKQIGVYFINSNYIVGNGIYSFGFSNSLTLTCKLQ